MTGLDNDLDVYARLQRWQMLQAPAPMQAALRLTLLSMQQRLRGGELVPCWQLG
jgi:hypothetical protein